MIYLILLVLPTSSSSTCPKDEFAALNEVNEFTLPKLPYTYNSLNPSYWDQLLYYHHDQVHNALISGLNTLVENNKTYAGQTVIQLLQNYAIGDYNLWTYAGGHYNHCLFWWGLISGKCADLQPSGQLLTKITATWGDFATFQSQFNNNAKGLFGSGWVFLCVDPNGNLVIKAKAEEYSPLPEGYFPFLALDVWEHSYYFFYMWDRSTYVDTWWGIVDWGLIEYLYEEYAINLLPVPV